jgi:hypothetical protein
MAEHCADHLRFRGGRNETFYSILSIPLILEAQEIVKIISSLSSLCVISVHFTAQSEVDLICIYSFFFDCRGADL